MKFWSAFACFYISFTAYAQLKVPEQNIKRMIHYKPDGKDFLLVNDSKRFTRALYGGNTAFRMETGAATVLDLPLNSSKELKSLRLKAIANDVVIGLISVALVR